MPAGVVAGVFYAVLRLAYVQFYSKLGLLPEEVGIGRTEILSQAIVGPIVVGVTYSVFLAALLSVTLLIMRVLTWRTLLQWGGLALATAFLATFALIYVQADHVATSVVEDGKSVRTIFLDLRLVRVPLLDVRALPVSVEWKDPDNVPLALRDGTDCMFYVGQGDDTAILYSVKTRRAIRFRVTDAVILTSRTPDQLPRECMSG